MIEVLRQFPFAFLGALIGTLALAWTIIKSPRKRLRAEVLWAVRVASKYREVPESIDLDGEKLPTDELYEVMVDVENTGNQDIEPKHFEHPLTLRFGEQTRAVLAEVIEEDPHGIQASLDVHSDSVTLNPVLLNAGDLVCLFFLVHRYDDLRAEGRIAGVRRVKRSVMLERFIRMSLLDPVGMLFLLVVFFLFDFLRMQCRALSQQ